MIDVSPLTGFYRFARASTAIRRFSPALFGEFSSQDVMWLNPVPPKWIM